jgi:hypothetical protein
MKPGPQKGRGSNGDDRTFADKSAEAWGVDRPEWVSLLAEAADAHSLSGAGKLIGNSGALVSNVLNNKYPGDLEGVERRVRGALMGETVICPRLDEMARNVCLDWQKKPFAATSSLRVAMYYACRGGCPHFRPKGGSNAE